MNLVICEENRCTGCMACYNSCPKQAIEIIQNERGFYRPQIIEEKCISCNRCRQVCPSLNPAGLEQQEESPKTIACWTNDASLRSQSTSGGVFSGLALAVLRQGGKVFGAVFDENFAVKHAVAHTAEDLEAMRGSKYVQSSIGDTFQQCKKYLLDGVPVLFSGTPCQIAGLKNYLGKPYENLLAVDIICHGTPSPLVFQKYLAYMEQKTDSSVASVQFRYKRPSWTRYSMRLVFNNGVEYQKKANEDPYLVAFLNDYISQKVCHQCPYTTCQRQGDLTIADFWGYMSEKRKFRNTEKGISLVLVNNEKGENFLKKLDGYTFLEKGLEEAKAGNQCLVKPIPQHKDTDAFWNDFLRDQDFSRVVSQYFYPRKPNIKHQISDKINDSMWLLPRGLQNQYKRVKKKLKG